MLRAAWEIFADVTPINLMLDATEYVDKKIKGWVFTPDEIAKLDAIEKASEGMIWELITTGKLRKIDM